MLQRSPALDFTPSTRRLARATGTAALTVLAVAALSACGGNGSSPPPTVTSTTVAVTSYSAPALVTVVGTNLSASSIAVTATGCSAPTRLTAAPNESTDTTAYYQCQPSAYTGTIAIAGTGTTLGSATFSLPAPTVTGTPTVVSTRYAAPVLVTIQGTNLDQGLAVTSPGCKDVTLLTAAPHVSSATTAYYQCTASGAYTSAFAIKGGDGSSLATAPLTVPAPIVTMAVTNGLGVNGNIVLALAGDQSPLTVDNFLQYVNSGFYNGTIFHRVVAGFVMQGGGYASPVTDLTTATLKTGLSAPIATEATSLSNVAGTIAMANAGAGTTTSQFFFNLANNSRLDGGYTTFGTITAGADVSAAILAAPATCVANSAAGTTDCLPVPNVVVTTATQTQ